MRYADRVAGISWETIEEVRRRLKERPALHFIAGEFVPSESGETFPSLDPATNEVLGVAARGGESGGGPGGQGGPRGLPKVEPHQGQGEEALPLEDRRAHREARGRARRDGVPGRGAGLKDRPGPGGPGGGELRLLRRVRRARHGGPDLPRGPGLALLHRAGSRGARGDHHPLERPPDALHLAHRPRLGLWEHRGPEARGVEPLHRHEARGDPKGGGPPPGGLQPGPGLWRGGGGGLGGPPPRPPPHPHRGDGDGEDRHAQRRRPPQAPLPGARRQKPRPGLRRRRLGEGPGRRGLPDLLLQRGKVHGKLQAPRGGEDL